MSSTLLQVLAILAVIVLLTTILIRPTSILLAILAVGFVIAGIVVSWRDVEQYHIRKAAAQLPAASSATAPKPEYSRSGP